jgi:hypothetical protein
MWITSVSTCRNGHAGQARVTRCAAARTRRQRSNPQLQAQPHIGQEVVVVGHEAHGALQAADVAGQPLDGTRVQVVRRLVQKEQVWGREAMA